MSLQYPQVIQEHPFFEALLHGTLLGTITLIASFILFLNFFLFVYFIYLAVSGLSRGAWVFIAAYKIFHCGGQASL